MFSITPFAISGLIIVITFVPLLILIFTKGRTKLAKIYGLHIFCVFIWGIGSFLIGINKDINQVSLIWKFACSGVYFIPVFFYHSTLLLMQKRNNLLLVLVYLQAIVFTVLTLSNQTFIEFHLVFNSFFYHHNSRWYFESFIIWELVVLICHINLFKFFTKNNVELKSKITFLILAGIGFIGGTGNFLPALGIYIYPFGNFLIPVYFFVISYAILKYQFLDIEIEFKKSLSYSILFAVVLLLYLTIVITSEKVIQHYLGYESPIISILTAFIIGAFLIPLHKRIQHYINKLFLLKDSIEIVQENERLIQEISQTEKLRSISLFASGMAHEIKNPLTSIKTLCTYLPQKINDKEFIDKFIPLVNKDVERINELVHDLLDYSKPSPPDKKDTDIHKLIEGILNTLGAQIVGSKIAIDLDLDRVNIQNVSIDSKQIKQAILNIVLNAIESIRSQGTLKISTRLSSDQTQLIITIADNGCGIAKQDLSHIFDPFFTKKAHGTGLGLSITHGIIKEHGGKIFVDSELGKGTTFRIELPIRKQT